MKLPISLGQKKTKAIEQMLEEFGIGNFTGFYCDLENYLKYLI